MSTTTDPPTAPEHLTPSELGTKQYWDSAYTLELANHASNPTDIGAIWFQDASAEERISAFLETMADADKLAKDSTTFLDLGTGNGHMLFALREDDWAGAMLGVDYSAEAVRLARTINASEEKNVRFEEWDILLQDAGEWLPQGGFDVVLDKGTFDAISLSEEVDERGRRVCEGYRERVEKLVRRGGRLLVTSCNWTEAEVRTWFGGGELEVEGVVRYPSFRFGGKEGSKICTVCFRRNETG